MIVEFLSCKIWQISDKTILLIACKGMHLLIRSDKTFIRSYTMKIPLIKSYTIKIPHIRSYTIKITLIRSYTIKVPLIRSYTIKIPLIRSYTIKIPLIRSYTIKITLIRSYTIKIPLIRSYTIKIPSYQILHDKNFLLYKFLKFGIFFILKTIQSCSQAVAKKLQHATLKCQSNKEKNILYCLLRLKGIVQKIIWVAGAFPEAVIIKLGWKFFSKTKTFLDC